MVHSFSTLKGSQYLQYTEEIRQTKQKHFTFSDIYHVLQHVSAKLPFFIDTHHVWNSAVYILTEQLPIMCQLLKKFYFFYVFFERTHLLTYP